jgi:class 3 adenylate cyclase
LNLKVGLHFGPAIAVTQNDRLDYFGSTINIAARLVSQSSGHDLILSTDARSDPEVDAWLTEHAGSLGVEPVGATLRGFDDRTFDLWRITPPHA